MKLGGGLNLILNLMRIALVAAIGAAQAQTSAPPSRPEFEVASIKPNNGVDERPGMQVSYGGHVTIGRPDENADGHGMDNIDESFRFQVARAGPKRSGTTSSHRLRAMRPRLPSNGGSPCYSPCWRIASGSASTARRSNCRSTNWLRPRMGSKSHR
jgi:hypothetical protein